jgi:hypothetical protein
MLGTINMVVGALIISFSQYAIGYCTNSSKAERGSMGGIENKGVYVVISLISLLGLVLITVKTRYSLPEKGIKKD